MRRRRIPRAALCLLLLVPAICGAASQPAPAPAPAPRWPAWERFVEAFVQDDGRVVEWTAQARTVSEAQAYGLFFALVADDRPRFERILGWTRDNLAQGDLGRHLPAWLWGVDDKGHWAVLDPNSAADADLWLAYDLLEAGRLWQRKDYADTGRALLRQVATEETAVQGKQTFLLPGPAGFDTPQGLRLNPSYLVPSQLIYFAGVDGAGPWRAILDGYLALLPNLAPSGCLPDWFLLTADGPRKDESSDGRGSYDAVRVYLWAGIMAPGGADETALHRALQPFVDFVRKAGRLPERWYPDGRAPESAAPAGVEAGLLPFYTRYNAPDLLQNAQKRLDGETAAGLVGKPARYYEQALMLFGQGWIEQRYRLESSGRLKPSWHD